jgi:hypothetical protein
VREFLPGNGLREKLADSILHHRSSQHLVYVRAFGRITIQHISDQPAQLRAENRGRRRVLAPHDLEHERVHIAGVKRVLERGELVENAPQAPDVTLVVVCFVQADLWR